MVKFIKSFINNFSFWTTKNFISKYNKFLSKTCNLFPKINQTNKRMVKIHPKPADTRKESKNPKHSTSDSTKIVNHKIKVNKRIINRQD